jgi:hypothetical protein
MRSSASSRRPRRERPRCLRASAAHEGLPAGTEHRDLKARLHLDEVLAAQPREQRPVGQAAAQEHMLTVVHLEPLAVK